MKSCTLCGNQAIDYDAIPLSLVNHVQELKKLRYLHAELKNQLEGLYKVALENTKPTTSLPPLPLRNELRNQGCQLMLL